MDIAPTLGEIDISLSFSITINLSGLNWPALFKPSQASPPVKAPSPITAITKSSFSPLKFFPILIPKAAEIEVEL